MILRPQFTREVGHVQTLELRLKTFLKHIRKHNGQPFSILPLFSDLTLEVFTEFSLDESVCTSFVTSLLDTTQANLITKPKML